MRRMAGLLWLLAGIGIIAGLIGQFEGRDFPSEEFWKAYVVVAIGAAIATTLIPVAQAGLVQFGEIKKRKRLQFENTIVQFLNLLFPKAEEWKAEWKLAGGEVFLVERRLSKWLWREMHISAGRVRMSPEALPDVQWLKGKGVIGQCWKDGIEKSIDLVTHFAPYQGISANDWALLDEKIRLGMTYEDFAATRDVYTFVSVAPIKDRNKQYLGCVSFDTRRAKHDPTLTSDQQLDRRRKEDEIAAKLASNQVLVEAYLAGLASNIGVAIESRE